MQLLILKNERAKASKKEKSSSECADAIKCGGGGVGRAMLHEKRLNEALTFSEKEWLHRGITLFWFSLSWLFFFLSHSHCGRARGFDDTWQ